MKIVLSGIETVNKGAELMLYAILQEVERVSPDAKVFLPHYVGAKGAASLKTSLDVSLKPGHKVITLARKVHLTGLLRKLHMLPDFLDDFYPVRGADCFIDSSGLLFSDQMNLQKRQVDRWRRLLEKYRRQGTRIVFMPQSFGPDAKPQTAAALDMLCRNADVIMPRDSVSAGFLEKHVIDRDRVFQYPDFTSSVEGTVPAGLQHLEGRVCIVPNMRMTDRGACTFDEYVNCIASVIKTVREMGFQEYLLVHEKNDAALASACAKALTPQAEVIDGLDSLEVKGLISTARLCVTSRYHAAASALNTCVPCLATGWSHKYAELFREYGVDGALLDAHDTDACVRSVREYLDAEKNAEVRAHLEKAVPAVRQKTVEMWNVIWNTGTDIQ